jgi:hypothetical protein
MRLKFHALTPGVGNIINHLDCTFDISAMIDSNFWNHERRVLVTNVSTVNN